VNPQVWHSSHHAIGPTLRYSHKFRGDLDTLDISESDDVALLLTLLCRKDAYKSVSALNYVWRLRVVCSSTLFPGTRHLRPRIHSY
jgi:hypothetical protein